MTLRQSLMIDHHRITELRIRPFKIMIHIVAKLALQISEWMEMTQTAVKQEDILFLVYIYLLSSCFSYRFPIKINFDGAFNVVFRG